MKKLFVLAVLALGFAAAASAQEGFKFTDNNEVKKLVPITNQYRSGTCWCFSALSYL